MLTISLTIVCLRYMYDGVILHAHPVHGESHNQCNTTGEVATVSVVVNAVLLSSKWHMASVILVMQVKYNLIQ